MTRRVFLAILSVFLFAVSAVGGELLQVLQPNTTAYSAAEVATLKEAIATLEGILNDYDYGSRRVFAAGDWQSRNFAEYTAGFLAERSYVVKLVNQSGWSDGIHTWVLVGIPVAGKTAWVPVESSPAAGSVQQTLGYVPMIRDASGDRRFEARYTEFSDVVELGANQPPVAKLRLPSSVVRVDEQVKLLALGSSDPDGEIMLYVWDFGDRKTETSTLWTVRHEYRQRGTYNVSLVVIDNHGTSATTSMRLRVVHSRSTPAETAPSSGGGCGCGG